MDKKYYLAGPMSGYPDFNFPLFHKVLALLRGVGMVIIPPVDIEGSMEGVKPDERTWAEFLAADVALIAGETNRIDGIVFLPQWSKSRGARLEAFVGLLEGEKRAFEFWEYYDDPNTGWTLLPVDRLSVLALITASMSKPT